LEKVKKDEGYGEFSLAKATDDEVGEGEKEMC
jgi:hypothetical protein